MTIINDVGNDYIIQINDISKIGALTVNLLALEGLNKFDILDEESISSTDVGFNYTKKDVGKNKREILQNQLRDFGDKYNKQIRTSYLNKNIKRFVLVFDYMTVNVKKIAELKIKKTSFIYCFIGLNSTHIFTYNAKNPSKVCFKCFCVENKLLVDSKSWRTTLVSKRELSNTFAMFLASYISNAVYKTINNVDVEPIVKIGSNNLEISALSVKTNQKCNLEKL